MSVPVPLADPTQFKPQEPGGLAAQHVDHLRFLPVQFDTDERELFLEPLQSPFGPTPFTVMAADGDDNIIGEPMTVDCLVRPLGRLAADRVEIPIDFAQIEIRRQRAERSPLRDPDIAANFDDLLDEMQNPRVLDPF